ncbi:MAG: asparaginase [Cetobacterium sp.]|uniref:asparaginase n=1 Tax=unclassified Cetobacterium TaxID=2630983 RepID=UPI00163CC1D3|nr:asparaginase [Cetobacterium sp. 2A]MBC2855762.1 asparaginase [Cetobacterium sp. 2A]
MLEKILIINTGGTIGMVNDDPNDSNSPLRPATNWNEIAKEHPILQKYKTDYYQFKKLIDSSNMNPQIWIDIAKVIEKNYDNYRGFVILHGTDTMAFSASGVSFMLKNLNKPIIFTGSQVPLNFSRSDALQNLITSIEIAGNEIYGVPLVPEVCIFFRDTLLRGNRARKIDARNYFGFSSPNYLPLGEVGAEISIFQERVLPISNEKFYVDAVADNSILVIELFPGLKPKYLKALIDSSTDLKGIILRTFGNGNAPTEKEFLDVLEYISKKDIIIINITQCITGSVKMGLYETSALLSKVGLISGHDMTPETAITKLMYLLGKNLPKNEIQKLMELNLIGEQSNN